MFLSREKMPKSTGKPGEEGNAGSRTRGKSLVLSIDQAGRIIKFNSECEQVSGYSKNEVLNKHLLDFLVPDRYHSQWKDLYSYLRKNRIVDVFRLPLLTRHGHEIMVSWSSFLVKNAKGVVVGVNLVGNLVTNWDDSNEPILRNQKIDEKREIDIEFVDVEKTGYFEDPDEIIEKLETITADLESKNEIFEKNLKSRSGRHKIKEVEMSKQSGYLFNRGLYSLSELFGGKKRKQEFENMIHELDEREKLLNNIESKLVNDKMRLNERVDGFRKWREKLELLEEEIENRRLGLVKQEKLLANRIADHDNVTDETEEVTTNLDFFDKIPESAVVVQRGILKKINGSFASLIGYNADEIVDKSLFDFIVPDCFSDVERYYLNRLKGEDVSFYETVLLTKDNNTVPVEISTKPTFFKGGKAEIAIIKKVKKE